MQSILAALPMAAIGLDGQGRIHSWNAYAEQLLGWGTEEVDDQPFEQLLFEQTNWAHSRALISEAFEQAELKEPSPWILLPAKHRNGQTLLLEIQVRKIQLADVPHCCWLFLRERDEVLADTGEWLCQQKQQLDVLQHLQVQHRQLWSVLQGAPLILIEVDGKGVFRFVEGAGLQVLQLEATRLVGKTVEEVYGADASVVALHRRALQGETFTAENQQDGRHYLTHFTPIFAKTGAADGYTAVINDVSSLKQTEVELARTQQALQESLAERERFLSHISHELRNPLLGIVALTQELRSMLQVQANIDLAETLETQAVLMQRLLDDLLTLNKLRAGTFAMRPQVFDVQELFHQLSRWAQLQATAKGLRLETDSNLTGPELCFADAQRIAQVLLNLLQNALRYTSSGQILFQLRGTRQPDTASYEAVFVVTDTGKGFDVTTAGEAKGSFGLGLNIVEELVKHLGATLIRESRTGHGSHITLKLQLPLVQASDRHATLRDNWLEGQRVLLVDDHILTRTMTGKALETAGARVCYAGSAQSALNSLAGFAPNVALVDQYLPDGLGTETLLVLQAKMPNLKGVVLSAQEAPGGQSGTFPWLTKPLNMQHLAAILATKEETAPAETPRLAQLRTALGQPDEQTWQQILQETVAQLEMDMAALQAPQQGAWRDRVHHAAHRIKSTLLQLGMPTLAQTARQLEKEVHTHSAAAVQQQAQQLHFALQGVAKSLQ